MKFDCKRLQRDIAEISYIAVTWRFAPAISKFTVALTLEREKPAPRRRRAKSRQTWTLRWRGVDSNFWFRNAHHAAQDRPF
jgi:hypothetical protein